MAKYNFEKILGKGSFSKVYLASNMKTAKEYAIKSVSKTLLYSNVDNMRSMINEIKVLRILDHPNIVKLYEVFETKKHVNLVMEYMRGGNLLSYFKKKKHYTEKDAATIILKVLEVINYCHSKNIVHRDLKPDNIMIV